MTPSHDTENLLLHPAVRALITRGARDGRITFAEMNDVLTDLELDEDAVELVLEALEKRAITVADEVQIPESVVKTAPKARKGQSGDGADLPAPRETGAPSRFPNQDAEGAPVEFDPLQAFGAPAGFASALLSGQGKHSDLDALIAELDALVPTDFTDVAGEIARNTVEQAGDEMDDEFAPVDDALKLYLNRMGQVPRLPPDEERVLARTARFGAPEESVEARQKLVEANLRLVVHLASHAAPRTTLSITDLLQEGNIGLLDAVERYNPDSAKTFGSYATWWIRRSLNRAIDDHARSMKLSAELYLAIQKLQRAQRELSQQFGRTPTRQELAQATGLTVVQIEEAQKAAARPLSLEQTRGGDNEGTEFGETLSDDEAETAEQTSDRREVAAGVTHLLADLSEREATIVSMRFGMGKYAAQGPRATEDVAKALGLSRERVHELETRAIGKLRTSAESTGFSSLLNPDHEDEE